VGREHKLDAHPVHEPLHLVGPYARRLELRRRGLDGLADGQPAVVAEGAGGAAPAQERDPEIFLGQVHQLEVEREGHRLVEGRPGIETRDGFGEEPFGVGVVRAARLGKLSKGLNRVEGLRALDPRDDAAERRTQPADLRPKGRHVAHRLGHAFGSFAGHSGPTRWSHAPRLKSKKCARGAIPRRFLPGSEACLPGSRRICFGRVKRRYALIFALAAALAPAARAEASGNLDLSADSTITFDEVSGESIARPNARLVDKGFLLTADEIRYNQRTLVATATGHVVLTRIGDRLLADRLTFNRGDGTFTARNLRAGRFPFYIEGPTAEGTKDQVIVHDATVTYREPGAWQPVIHAKSLTYAPGHYLRVSGANLGIGKYLPVPIARIGEDLAHETSQWNMTLDGGYRHTLGPYADLGLHIPLEPGFSMGPDIGIYTFRGIMLGPLANYDVTTGDGSMQGYLKSGYIYDLGRRLTDILGNPVPPNRAFAEWQHNQQVNARPHAQRRRQLVHRLRGDPRLPLEGVRARPGARQLPRGGLHGCGLFLASVFTRFQPDAFYPVQERLPEIRFDLLPTAVGGGIYVRFDSGVAHLEENPPDGGLPPRERPVRHLPRDQRAPSRTRASLTVTPVVGGRYTQYWDTQGAPSPAAPAARSASSASTPT
jgi:hypothetical protein